MKKWISAFKQGLSVLGLDRDSQIELKKKKSNEKVAVCTKWYITDTSH